MSQNSDVDEVGHCPICRELMVEMGKLVVCPAGHYKAVYDAWNLTWIRFDPQSDDADKLVKDLLELNVETVDQKEVEKIQTKAMGET